MARPKTAPVDTTPLAADTTAIAHTIGRMHCTGCKRSPTTDEVNALARTVTTAPSEWRCEACRDHPN